MRLKNNPDQESNPNKKKNWIIVVLKNVWMVIVSLVVVALTVVGLNGDKKRR